ncbi:hypothetical protein HNR03_002312 [Pseudomonas sp. JAI111]|nr:hypothetical protein [Pseudomonas sp. JAI111]
MIVPTLCVGMQSVTGGVTTQSVGTIIIEQKNGDPRVAVLYCVKSYAALNSLCGSITNFFGTPASNSP